jgi:hypothetical protein
VGTTVPRLGVARTHRKNTLAMIGKATQPFEDVLCSCGSRGEEITTVKFREISSLLNFSARIWSCWRKLVLPRFKIEIDDLNRFLTIPPPNLPSEETFQHNQQNARRENNEVCAQYLPGHCPLTVGTPLSSSPIERSGKLHQHSIFQRIPLQVGKIRPNSLPVTRTVGGKRLDRQESEVREARLTELVSAEMNASACQLSGIGMNVSVPHFRN